MMAYTSTAYLQWLKDTDPAAHRTLRTTSLSLGYHPDTEDELFVDGIDRFSGTYIVGIQGMGKSGLLERMIHQDAERGNAIIVIDPHGDLADHCLAALPAERLSQTYVLDLLDETYPFGINLFSTPIPFNEMTEADQTAVVERVMHVIDVLFAGAIVQVHLPRYLKMGAITLLSNPGTSLYDMMRLLRDTTYRRRLLASVQDFDVRDFWRDDFDDLSEAKRKAVTDPLISRLQHLFVGSPLVRNVIGQRHTTINFRQAIEEKQIIFVSLPIKKLKQNADHVGMVIVSQIHEAIFSFGDIPDEQRPGVSVYIDEFQHFVTEDIAELFTEGRKYGVRLAIAHQVRAQVPTFLQSQTKSAQTRVAFQLVPEDATEMAKVFPDASVSIDPADIETRPAEYLTAHGSKVTAIDELIRYYLLPLTGFRRGHAVEIQHGGIDLLAGTVNALYPSSSTPIRVDDPIPYLNSLLHEVMVQGAADVPINPRIPRGFANGGIGFFAAVRRLSSRSRELQPDFVFPLHLVRETLEGPMWTRPPDSPREQLLHCLFCLRQTMDYLAEHPIGKETQTTSADVAAMLTQLPKRAAFVRTGTETGVIYTHPTPGQLTGPQLLARQTMVREQTRSKYCRPRSEVVQGFIRTTGPTSPSGPTDPTDQVPEDADAPVDETALSDVTDEGTEEATTEIHPRDEPPGEDVKRWDEVPDDEL